MIGLRTTGHGFADLRAHPWRATLSGLSLCIGVLAVIAIFTVGAVTAEVFIATEEQLTGRQLTASGQLRLAQPGPEQLRAALDAAEPVTTTGGAAAILAHPSGLTGVAPRAHYEAGGVLRNQSLTLVAGELAEVRRLPLLAGRWFDSTADLPVELVLNAPAARRWGGVDAELVLRVTERQPPITAYVSGVIADGQGDPIIYAPLPAILHIRPYTLDSAGVEVLLHHPYADVGTLTSVAEQMGVAAGGELVGDLRRVDTVRLLLAQLRTQQRAFLAIAVLALLISALGMLNIGLASVGERSRELVIRRAVGATRADIIAQLLVAALVVAVVATLVGVAIAWLGLQWWLPQRIGPASAIEPPSLPWPAVAAGLAASVGTTIAGSILPAVVAARLDVATALRD